MADYIDNKVFNQLMIDHHQKILAAKEANLPLPKASDHLGRYILMICNKLMGRYNFVRYSVPWKEEMSGAAIISCVSALNKFDPSKSNNPFAYFTSIAYHAAVNVIVNEKKQMNTKIALMQNVQQFFDVDNDSKEDFNDVNANNFMEYVLD